MRKCISVTYYLNNVSSFQFQHLSQASWITSVHMWIPFCSFIGLKKEWRFPILGTHWLRSYRIIIYRCVDLWPHEVIEWSFFIKGNVVIVLDVCPCRFCWGRVVRRSWWQILCLFCRGCTEHRREEYGWMVTKCFCFIFLESVWLNATKILLCVLIEENICESCHTPILPSGTFELLKHIISVCLHWLNVLIAILDW